jgi:hypothetical protein
MCIIVVNIFYHFLFLVFSVFVLLKAVFYALYEIKTQNNKTGGIAVICFTIVVLVFSNIVVFLK